MKLRNVLRAAPMALILLLISAAAPLITRGNPLEDGYQRDMDRVRIKNVDYVSFLILEYFQKTGNLPLADRLHGKPIQVYFPDSRADLVLLEDAAKRVVMLPTGDLKAALEKGLSRTINLPSDPQSVATYAPNLYVYHVDPTRACVIGHLYGEAPYAVKTGTYYTYQQCVLNNGFDVPLSPEEVLHQRDADIFRARHLIEWAEAIEAYYKKVGLYPLQRRVEGDKIALVQIATREQQVYLDPANPKYVRKIDNTKGFTVVSVKEFVADIEGVLGREVVERYDSQRQPNGGTPLYLSYFVGKNGYLIWTACQTCPGRANSFSPLLGGGTPTLKIGSDWFVKNVRKTQTIESLRANKQFIDFVGDGPRRPEFFENLERAQARESKN